MLKKLNIVLAVLIIGLAFYAIILNTQIYYLYNNNYKLKEKYDITLKINKQLELEFIAKTSNIFVDKFATEELNMRLPKKIHTLDL